MLACATRTYFACQGLLAQVRGTLPLLPRALATTQPTPVLEAPKQLFIYQRALETEGCAEP